MLESLRPVIDNSRDVRTHVDKIVEVAGWMAYEELPMPRITTCRSALAKQSGRGDGLHHGFDAIDSAFTDFKTHMKFQVDYAGQHWSDSEALFACIKRAMDQGTPILDGKFLAEADARRRWKRSSPATSKCP